MTIPLEIVPLDPIKRSSDEVREEIMAKSSACRELLRMARNHLGAVLEAQKVANPMVDKSGQARTLGALLRAIDDYLEKRPGSV